MMKKGITVQYSLPVLTGQYTLQLPYLLMMFVFYW